MRNLLLRRNSLLRNVFLTVALLVLIIGFSADSKAQDEVVVPNALAVVEGNSFSSLPLACGSPGYNSQRYQQIYAADQLQSGNITEIHFRLDPNQFLIVPATIQNLQIDLAITQVNPSNASTTFANNIGSDLQTVFTGDLNVNPPVCTSTPCPFDIVIPITPYSYSPLQGNLLLDITVSECSGLTVLFDTTDSAQTSDTVMNRIYSDTPDGAGDATGVIDNDRGLVTEFVFQPITRNVPTLSELGLIAMAGLLGIVGFYVVRRRKAAA